MTKMRNETPMMMRRSIDISPCLSSNCKYIKPLPPSAALTEPEMNEYRMGDSVLKIPTNSGIETEKIDSSGSCSNWSSDSFLEKCPRTPNPVCSPITYVSCSPPTPTDQYFSQPSSAPDSPNSESPVVSNYGKKSAVANGGEAGPSLDLCLPKLQNFLFVEKSASSNSTNCRNSISLFECEEGRTIQKDEFAMSPSASSQFATACGDDETIDLDHMLPVVKEIEEEPPRRTTYIESIVATHASKCFMDRYARGFEEDSVMGSQSSQNDEPFAALDVGGPRHALMSEIKRNEVEAKLVAWKEAKILKLVNKLRKEEAQIGAWEFKKTTEARACMDEVQSKLERKRIKAMEKMQRRLVWVEKKADRQKLEARDSTFNKISKVSNYFEKIRRTGKLPWRLLF